MEINVESMTKIDYKNDMCYAYTVYIEDHRILTIATYHGSTAAKWIKDIQNSHRARNESFIVGVCIEKETPDHLHQRHDLDLTNYDLDRLAKVMLGKHVDVIRSAKEVDWYHKQRGCYISRKIKEEKVKYCTVDPLLCF